MNNKTQEFPDFSTFEMPETEVEKVAWFRVFDFLPNPYIFYDYEDYRKGWGQRAFNLYQRQIKHEEYMLWQRFVYKQKLERENNNLDLFFYLLILLGFFSVAIAFLGF